MVVAEQPTGVGRMSSSADRVDHFETVEDGLEFVAGQLEQLRNECGESTSPSQFL